MPYKQLTQFFGSKPNTPLLAHSALGRSLTNVAAVTSQALKLVI